MGIGDWAQSPIPNPQSPIPNPHSYYNFNFFILLLIQCNKYLKNKNHLNMDISKNTIFLILVIFLSNFQIISSYDVSIK